MKAAIFPYKRTSESAKFLADYIEGRLVSGTRELASDEILINWGGSQLVPSRWDRKWLNHPDKIYNAVHKLRAFKLFKEAGVLYPPYTTNRELVIQWLVQNNIVVARQTSCGFMGQGISILKEPNDSIPEAEFYSKHVKHDEEYRIHVFKDQIINVGQKFKYDRTADPLIRNWGAWRFKNPGDAPYKVMTQSLNAIKALGLHFGAVDVGYCYNGDMAYVFEVNTAPGAGHNTITRYAKVFLQYLRSL